MLRAANTAMDQGLLLAGDRGAILAVLASFDAVFDVLEDRDAEATTGEINDRVRGAGLERHRRMQALRSA